MASKSKSSSASRSSKLLGEKSEKQLAFEREAREKLKNADMTAFDQVMRTMLKKTPESESRCRAKAGLKTGYQSKS